MVAAQRKSKRIWIWGGLLALVVVGCLVAWGMHRGGTHFDPSRLDKVTRGEIDQSVVATGKVQPITKIELKSKASGIVQNLYVDINQHVHRGQLLAQLDVRAHRDVSVPERPQLGERVELVSLDALLFVGQGDRKSVV